MPSSPIQNQNNLLVGTDTYFCSKRFELRFKQGDADTGGQVKDGAARCWVDEANEVAPGKSVFDGSKRTLAV
jgi:hypothetical protein